MKKAIEIKNLHKSYRKGFFRKHYKILKGLNFSVEAGAITGFLGSNGAGKTTTLKCILNLALPDEGTIQFFEEGVLSSSISQRIGFLPERPYFYEYLTGTEFLRFYGKLSTQLTNHELDLRIRKLLAKVRLEHAADRPLRTYSKGMLQRVGMAQALIHEPQLVILDEPVAGLDPDGRIEMASIIQETAQSGSAVFFSSHLLHDAEVLCKNLIIIRQGVIVYDGSTQKLLQGLETGYQVSYSVDGRVAQKMVPTIEALQSSIDELRKKKNDILEVKIERPSLEAAFAKIAGPGSSPP